MAVRLGNSGLKVSRIILGCMSYGSPEWQSWILPEEEAIKHIKFAFVSTYLISVNRSVPSDTPPTPDRYDHGITSFDTADVRHFPSLGTQ